MKTRRLFFTLTTLATIGMTLTSCSADEPADDEGVIQITDQPSDDGYGIVMTTQEFCGTDACASAGCDACSNGCGPEGCYADGYNARMSSLLDRDDSFGSSMCRYWRTSQRRYIARNRRMSWCLVGWMVPTGNCGKGAPPLGHYDLTYAQDADYFDERDGKSYGATGYGMPMTVPIAPNVNYQFNYGWGTPSSRITPLGVRQPYTKAQPIHW